MSSRCGQVCGLVDDDWSIYLQQHCDLFFDLLGKGERMAFLVADPPSGVRSDHFFELLDKGKSVAFLVTDPPSGRPVEVGDLLGGYLVSFGRCPYRLVHNRYR